MVINTFIAIIYKLQFVVFKYKKKIIYLRKNKIFLVNLIATLIKHFKIDDGNNFQITKNNKIYLIFKQKNINDQLLHIF